MEEKKKSKKVTSKKPKEKVVKKTNKKETSKEKKKAFTLIELLAVIIILGILMIIAIPSVTSYINNSRKSAYVDTAKEIISGARNFVNEGKVDMYNTDVTYYIDYACIKTENAQKSPYGDFVSGQTYVIVTYDGKGYNYYWVSRDTTGQGVSVVTSANTLDEDDIESDIAIDAIKTTVGVGTRSKTQVINANCQKEGEETPVTTSVAETGGNSEGNNGGSTPTPVSAVCKRATSLHTATCNRTDSYGCRRNNIYDNGATITYGNLGTGETLTPGDAFDCDVNGDGTFDATTERFYYVTSSGDNAVLIYYTNVTGGTTATQNNYAYYASANQNWHGPVTAYEQLPSTTQWSNSGIIAPGTRQITAETGATTTNNGSKPIESFTYEGKAARLLTDQEVQAACGITLGSYTIGELDGCNYLMENVGQYETKSGTYGYWLESPHASDSYVWLVNSTVRNVGFSNANNASFLGVRPVITVLKSNISY